MPSSSKIIYQPYIAGSRGTLKASIEIPCSSAEEGSRRAERALAGGSILGAQVVRVTHDDDAGEFGEPEYLVSFGRVPDPE